MFSYQLNVRPCGMFRSGMGQVREIKKSGLLSHTELEMLTPLSEFMEMAVLTEYWK
jgi:hypothetical protein